MHALHRNRPRAAWLALAAALLALPAALPARAGTPAQKWVATWAQAMTSNMARAPHQGDAAKGAATLPTLADFTLRQTVHVSAGGGPVRIRLSNYFGRGPLVVDSARIALGAADARDPTRIVPSSDRVLRFHGRDKVVLPPGGLATSDAVALQVPALSTVVVSLHFAGATQLSDVHPMEHAPTTAAVAGDATAATTLAHRPRLGLGDSDGQPHVYALAGVDVQVPESTRGIVAFGDSITDGAYATAPYRTWPGVLATLANAPGSTTPMAVVNTGISADELTTDQIGWPVTGMSGLKRFERDVIDQPGVTDVLVLIGSNDVNRGIDQDGQPNGALAGDLVAGLRMLADVAHQHGLRIYVGTIPPFAGFTTAGWFTPGKEAVRRQVNAWIAQANGLDGVLPFADVLSGPYTPSPLAAAQATRPPGLATRCAGDTGLHPNDRGYTAMGHAAFAVLGGPPMDPRLRCDSNAK